jgi:hypothetical protein
MGLMLGLALLTGTTTVAFSQDTDKEKEGKKDGKKGTASTDKKSDKRSYLALIDVGRFFPNNPAFLWLGIRRNFQIAAPDPGYMRPRPAAGTIPQRRCSKARRFRSN